MRNYDIIVVGCGVVGAAVAYELSKYNLKVAIIEKENDIATGATKANSGIIHAGFDPKPGSLMAKLNVRGAELAEGLSRELDVPYERTGAMVVAFNEADIATLRKLLERGKLNGVKDLRILDSEEAHRMEPELAPNVLAALYAPTSAIISPWEYCFAFAETAIRNGVKLFLNCELENITKGQVSHMKGWRLTTPRGEFFAPIVINTAGVYSIDVHNMASAKKYDSLPRIGEYFLLDKAEGSRVNSTIFQCPDSSGKGILVSKTTHGNLIVGPTSRLTVAGESAFTADGIAYVKKCALKSVPTIDFKKNIRNFAGLRSATDAEDFIIKEQIEGFIDCVGICSPGLSAAPAIGEYVVELVKKSIQKSAKGNIGDTLKLNKKFKSERKVIRFNSLSDSEKAELVEKNPSYGRVICRCETITEGEILAAFDGPIPPSSLDGIKRRCGTGMGRCQGGFCGPRIAELLVEERGKKVDKIVMEKAGSKMFFGMTKGGKQHV